MLVVDDIKGKRVHMIGIGGSSMSGLAELLMGKGAAVSGSDRASRKTLDGLRDKGVTVYYEQVAENIKDPDLVVYSAAIAEDHPERVRARELGIPSVERSELLGMFCGLYKGSIAVSGTHGKTSTTSMIAGMLLDAGLDPSVHIGGVYDKIGGSVRAGDGDWFVTEACEFGYSFLTLYPTVAVLLNIDADHLEVFGDVDGVERAFARFVENVEAGGCIIGCGDDERVVRVMEGARVNGVTYGFGADCAVRGVNLVEDRRGRFSMDVEEDGRFLASISLSIPGKQFALNALAVMALARILNIDPEAAAASLNGFANARRRFEHTGDADGVMLYHDYGHNPGEYRTVVPLARKACDGHLYVVCQPHTYSRTKLLFDEYPTAFPGADTVLVTDIYAAREKDPGDIKADMLIAPLREAGVNAVLTPTFEDCRRYLKERWKPGDLVITLGCGDINLLNEYLAERA